MILKMYPKMEHPFLAYFIKKITLGVKEWGGDKSAPERLELPIYKAPQNVDFWCYAQLKLNHRDALTLLNM